MCSSVVRATSKKAVLTEETRQAKQINLKVSSFAGGDLVEKPFELVSTASSLLEKSPDLVEKPSDPVEELADSMSRDLLYWKNLPTQQKNRATQHQNRLIQWVSHFFYQQECPTHQVGNGGPARKPPVQ
jgi:hypothetical protein